MPKPPSVDESRDHYDQWNSDFRSGGFDEIEEEIRLRAERVLQVLRELKLDRPKVLEVGCGTGWVAERLCEFAEVTATDLSPAAIEIAKQRGLDAKFLAGDFYEQEFPHESFDCLLCIETLFYVPDQPRFVARMAQLLKPDGWLGVTTINEWVYERSSDIGPPPAGQVRQWLSKQEILDLLAPHFEIRSVETVAPRGDLGVLRLINSYKITSILNRIFSAKRVIRAKEKLGLGGGIVFIVQKRS